MVTSCFALCCTERWEKGTPYSFHRIPRDRERAKRWLKALRREDVDESRWKNVWICSKHFHQSCFTKNNRGVNLLPGAFPTLHLGLDKERPLFKTKKGRKKTRRYHFGDYSEEHIKKSPRDALRAFRLAKVILQHKNERIRELAISQMCLRKRLMRAKIKIDQMPYSMRKKLGLNAIKENLAKSFNQKKKALLSKPGKNSKTNKTALSESDEESKQPESESDEEPEQADSESDEEPEQADSESDEESKQADSESDEETKQADSESAEETEQADSDEEPEQVESDEESEQADSNEEPEHPDTDEAPSLPDCKSDTSDLMDEDDWAKTFQEDPEAPEEEEALGIPVQGGLKVENTSPEMTVIKSAKSHHLPVPVMLSNCTSPVLQNRLTARLGSTTLPVRGTVSKGRRIVMKSKSTQTEFIDPLDSEEDSTAIADPESESTAIADPESESTAIADSESESTATVDSAKGSTAAKIGMVDGSVSKKTIKKKTYDSFGAFVAKRLNALGDQKALFLQTEFGTLLYKVENGELNIR